VERANYRGVVIRQVHDAFGAWSAIIEIRWRITVMTVEMWPMRLHKRETRWGHYSAIMQADVELVKLEAAASFDSNNRVAAHIRQ
jgi:hypothetical protein